MMVNKIVEDTDTMNILKLFQFFAKKKPEIPMKEKDQNTSRFKRAEVLLLSNPLHQEPVQEVESMEDVFKINEDNAIRDQLVR